MCLPVKDRDGGNPDLVEGEGELSLSSGLQDLEVSPDLLLLFFCFCRWLSRRFAVAGAGAQIVLDEFVQVMDFVQRVDSSSHLGRYSVKVRSVFTGFVGDSSAVWLAVALRKWPVFRRGDTELS